MPTTNISPERKEGSPKPGDRGGHVLNDLATALRTLPSRIKALDALGTARHVSRVALGGERAESAVLLTIDAGRHKGAAVRLSSTTVTIGSDLACDVVLTDDGVLPRHAILDIQPGTIFTRALVQATGEVDLLDGAIAPGRSQAVLLPAKLMIGDASITLDFVGAKARQSSMKAWGLAAIAAAVLALFGLPLLWLATAELPSLVTASTSRPLSEAKLTDARRRVEGRLEQAGLGMIKVTVRPGGLALEGSLAAEQFQRWRALKSELRVSEPAFPLLQDQVSARTEERAPRHLVAAISFAPAYVVTPDGRKAQVGEPIGEGWVVREISEAAVVLERGGTRATLPF